MNEFNDQISEQSSVDDMRCQRWRNAPESNRKCNDIKCVWIFLLIFGTFLGSSAYYINQHSSINKGENSTTPKKSQQSMQLEIDDFWYVIAVSGLLAMILSLLYVWLMLQKTQIMTKLCLIFSILSLLGLSAYFYAYDQDAASISLLITAGIYVAILNCYKQLLKWGILIVKSSSELIFNHTSLFLISLIKVIASGLFITYWLYSLSCVFSISSIKQTRGQMNQAERFFIWYFIFVEIFITILMYYVMVFMVGIACSFWYYRIEGKNYFWQAYRWAFSSQFGSLVFAAMTLALIKMGKLLASMKLQQLRNENPSSDPSLNNRSAISTQVIRIITQCFIRFCLRLIRSILQNLQQIFKVLNHNSVLIMAITGQGFIQSAKSAISIIGSHLPMFLSTEMVSNILIFWGTLFVSGITTFISCYWIESYHISYNMTYTIVIAVFVVSMLVGNIIFSVIVEAISGLFLLFCMDNRFSAHQPSSNVLSGNIREAFNYYNQR